MSETDAPPVVRRWLRLPAPPRVDLALAAAFVVMTLAEALFSPAVTSPVEHAVVGSLAMALLAWRRTAPLLVALLIAHAAPQLGLDRGAE